MTIRWWPLPVWAWGVVIIILIAVGSGFALWATSGASRPSVECEKEPEVEPPSEGPASPATLVPEKAEGLLISFDRSRVSETRSFFLNLSEEEAAPEQEPGPAPTTAPLLPPEGTLLRVREKPLQREEVGGVIRGEDYFTTAVVSGAKEVTLTVCINPTTDGIDPGTYAGSVRLDDSRVGEVTVPVKATFQYFAYWWTVPVYFVIVLFVGSLFVWASGKRTAGEDITGQSLGSILGWMGKNFVGIGLGTIAATSVFLATYWRNPVWGAKAPEDWFSLLGVMFSAFTAALAAGSATVHRGSASGN